jgi:hypothetical protein
VVARPRGGDTISHLKVLALAACLLALLALAAVLSAHAALVGGPILDATIYGNKEFYPGQIAPLLVLVQNEGYLQSLSGFKTGGSLISQSSVAASAGEGYSASSSGSRSSDYATTSSSSSRSSGDTENAVATEDVGTTNDNSASITGSANRAYNSNYQTSAGGGVDINTAQGIDLEATTELGLVCQLTPGSCPVQVITGDRALVGSLLPGEVVGGPRAYSAFSPGLYQPTQYWIRINPDVKPGHYLLPLVCTYKQLIDDYEYASVDGTVLRNKNYAEMTNVILLDIVIMPKFDLVINNMV